MKNFKVIIIDDDEISIDNLTISLKKFNNLCLIGSAKNGVKAKRMIKDVQPDLLFLDVELPDTTGMNLLSEISDDITWNMKVVFYTAYNKYMIDAIRSSAFDYLLKPFKSEDLDVIVERFVKNQQYGNEIKDTLDIVSDYGKPIMIYTPKNDIRMLKINDIGFFRYISDRKQWEVLLKNQIPIILHHGLNASDILKYSKKFFQIHQSFIINIDYLLMIKNDHCILYPPFENAKDLLISKKYRKDLENEFIL